MRLQPAGFLAAARRVLLTPEESRSADPIPAPDGPLRVGIDLGTAYVVAAVLDQAGNPLAGEYRFAQVARDGLVVDFHGAVAIVRGMVERLERRTGPSRSGFSRWSGP